LKLGKNLEETKFTTSTGIKDMDKSFESIISVLHDGVKDVDKLMCTVFCPCDSSLRAKYDAISKKEYAKYGRAKNPAHMQADDSL